MVSIAQVVERIIEQKPFLESALARGLINYTKLAEDLLDEVKESPELQDTDVRATAVMMSLRRIGDRLQRDMEALKQVFSGINLEMDYSQYNLFSATIKRHEDVNTAIQQLYDIVDIGTKDFLTITSGMGEVTIISNLRFKDQILALFDKGDILAVDTELASLSLSIPQDSFQTPGLFYLVTKQLYWDGVNIREVVSTLSEMNFILKEIDIPDTLRSLRKLL
ncbi:MAG: hypothetical protein ACXAE3_07960 [Candidatus Kariarchaeaceae archaeon]